MNKFKGSRVVFSILPIIIFLFIHIAFYWIAYKHSPFEPNYIKIYLSGYFEIYLFVALIVIAGIMIKAKYFCSIFFVFAIYGEVQMLFGYWKLGAHPTMGPAMMQFLLYVTGFAVGSIAEVAVRAIHLNAQKHKQG